MVGSKYYIQRCSISTQGMNRGRQRKEHLREATGRPEKRAKRSKVPAVHEHCCKKKNIHTHTLVKRQCAIGAQPMGAPGCPDMDFCTMSAARMRMVLIAFKKEKTRNDKETNQGNKGNGHTI